MTITFEGKYQHIKRHIRDLERQGWRIVSITGEPSFKFTVCVMTNESTNNN